mmetsp:Transcript_32041/g.84409  ORF Transcript_32041/g.84409 Transcript_32041/m.84409 type:complete len:209 (+) Transcript_32041:125-751(+)
MSRSRINLMTAMLMRFMTACCLVASATAFVPSQRRIVRPATASTVVAAATSGVDHDNVVVGRRAAIGAAIGVLGIVNAEVASASGGATAGGAYLIRAKQRYNDRVVAGAAAFMALGTINPKDPFFLGEKEGPAADFLTAAFLLANSFRSNSTTAPDNLPTVKAFKAFKAEYEAMLKSAGKKNAPDTADHYAKAKDLLQAYLVKVELAK